MKNLRGFMDSFERKFIVFGTIGVIGFFAIFILINRLLGEITRAFYWGLPVGFIFGISTCLLISETWDPVYLRPKKVSNTQGGRLVYWAVPIGVLMANILTRIFNQEVIDFVLSITLAWLFITLGYIALQVWRHSPK